MKLRFTDILFTAMTISLLAAGWAGATCYESSGDGKLLAGRMADFLPRILETYETGVPQGAVYGVQKPEGYYFKICDEPGQINYFMRKWAEEAVPGGKWAPFYTTGDKRERSQAPSCMPINAGTSNTADQPTSPELKLLFHAKPAASAMVETVKHSPMA